MENTNEKKGEEIALLIMGSNKKASKWLSRKQSFWIKSYMEQDLNKTYYASFGSLTISPLNQCGSFNYYGSIEVRKEEQKEFEKKMKEEQKEFERKKLMREIMDKAYELSISPDDYIKLKGIKL